MSVQTSSNNLDKGKTTCGNLAQKYTQLSELWQQMRQEQDNFIKNSDSFIPQNLEAIAAGFENDSLEYSHGFMQEALGLVRSQLTDTSPRAQLDTQLAFDHDRGRIIVIGSINQDTFRTAYIPALIRSVTRNILIGSKVKSLDYIEEIGGSLRSGSDTFSAARLQKAMSIHISAEEEVALPTLTYMVFGSFSTKRLRLPALKTVGRLRCWRATEELNLSALEIADELQIYHAENISLPNLTRLETLSVEHAVSVNAPMLTKIESDLDITRLDPKHAFRDAFPELRYIGNNQDEAHVVVGDQARKEELEALRTDPIKPLHIHGDIAIDESSTDD